MLRIMRRTSGVVILALAAALGFSSHPAPPQSETALNSWLVQYRHSADTLVKAAQSESEGWRRLGQLCTEIGPRLSGSTAYDSAARWAAARMRDDGLAVSTFPASVPHWERGVEQAEITRPVVQRLSILGLGGTVATPPDGITARVTAVRSFEELGALGEAKVHGSIVLFNPDYRGYGKTVAYRVRGPSRAARLGAVATLIRSIAPAGLDVPHTGQVVYDPDAPAIPAAALTVSDAESLYAMAKSGEVTVRLRLGGRTLDDSPCANVVGEIKGRELPEQIVVIGGHLDSWDVGQGAHDDGAGCVAAMEAARLILKTGLQPRRTIRVVLWANEENGLRGADAYRKWIGDGLANHVAAIELDSGAEKPLGFGLGSSLAGGPGYAKAFERLRLLSESLQSVEVEKVFEGGGGADIGPLVREGTPGLSLRTSGDRYFLWHHSAEDTIDKVDPKMFARHVAAVAVMCFGIADMPERLDEMIRLTTDN